jgi:hypothetical protein
MGGGGRGRGCNIMWCSATAHSQLPCKTFGVCSTIGLRLSGSFECLCTRPGAVTAAELFAASTGDSGNGSSKLRGIPTGCSGLDALLGGAGVACGTITEFCKLHRPWHKQACGL